MGIVSMWAPYLLKNLETPEDETLQPIKDDEKNTVGKLSVKWTPRATTMVNSENDWIDNAWTYRLDIEMTNYVIESPRKIFILYDFYNQRYMTGQFRLN